VNRERPAVAWPHFGASCSNDRLTSLCDSRVHGIVFSRVSTNQQLLQLRRQTGTDTSRHRDTDRNTDTQTESHASGTAGSTVVITDRHTHRYRHQEQRFNSYLITRFYLFIYLFQWQSISQCNITAGQQGTNKWTVWTLTVAQLTHKKTKTIETRPTNMNCVDNKQSTNNHMSKTKHQTLVHILAKY